MRDAAKTLVLPIETGNIEGPSAASPWLFLEAEALPGWQDRLIAVSDHRGRYLDLAAAGYSVSPDILEGEFAGALVLLSRSRALSDELIARALEHVGPGGTIVMAGENNIGAQSARKRLAGRIELSGSTAKHHATAFWFNVPEDIGRLVTGLRPATPPRVEGFETGAGHFSAGEIDAGSRALAQTLPSDLGGTVADFGAGWGYVSVDACRRSPAIRKIELFEVSHAALQSARRNMAALAPDCAADFHWHDLTREPVERRFDAVVMNPPFHDGRAAEPSLGQAFIAAASRALVPGGRLFMVANRQLPYEKILAGHFRKVTPLAETGSYKLIAAVR